MRSKSIIVLFPNGLMTSSRALSLAFAFILLTSPTFASKQEAEAAALIEHAKQLSDIRAEGAPAFELKIGFKTIKDDGSASEGEYTEVWISKTKWRREAVVGDFRRIQIAFEGKRWLLSSGAVTPRHVGDVCRLSDSRNLRPADWRPQRLENREVNGISARCLETASSPNTSACFDKTTGMLISETTLSHAARAQMVCSYADYEKFGDHVLARSYACSADGHREIEARVLELTGDPTPDPGLFVLPEGARESVNCLSSVPPKPVYAPDPTPPRHFSGSTMVMMSIAVGIDGTPRNLKVTSAQNLEYDEEAQKAVRKWRFTPAICDGEPVETQMMVVEIEFHHY